MGRVKMHLKLNGFEVWCSIDKLVFSKYVFLLNLR
jgi:hypothetical protein